MRQTEMTCICCPLGCSLTVSQEEDGSVGVDGNSCPRGAEYGVKELTDPTRTVTTTVRVKGRKQTMVSVKTSKDIPKGKIMECMKALAEVEVQPPVHMGDVICRNVAGTGADVVATKNLL